MFFSRTWFVIVSFRHKGLENFFYKGQAKGIKPDHIKKVRQVLAVLHAARTIDDIKSVKSLRYHPLTGSRKSEHAVWVNKNWRVTFEFNNSDIHLTNYEDYHDRKVKR